MANNRVKSGLVHIKGKQVFDVSKEKETGKLFIKNTFTEVPTNQVTKKNGSTNNKSYDFNKPSQSQNLGDEWSDYAWSGNDF